MAYRIGQRRADGKQWSGDNYGWQAPATHNKLRSEGKFRAGTQAIDRIANSLARYIPKPLKDYGNAIQSAVAKNAEEDRRSRERTGVGRIQNRIESRPNATERTLEAASRGLNVDRRVINTAAAVGQAAIEGKVGINALRVLPTANKISGLKRATATADSGVTYGSTPFRPPNAPKARNTKVTAPRVIDRTSGITKSNAASPVAQQPSFNQPIKENPVPYRIRQRLEERREQLGGLSGQRNAQLPPSSQSTGRTPKKPLEVIEVRQGSRQHQPPQGGEVVYDNRPRPITKPYAWRNGSNPYDGIDDLQQPYTTAFSEGVNPSITARKRGKTGDAADQHRALSRKVADRRANAQYEAEAVKVQQRYDANPDMPGKKGIQEADRKTLNKGVRERRAKEERRVKDNKRILEAIKKRNHQNIAGARYDINDNLSKEQLKKMAGEVTNPYGRKLTPEELKTVLRNDSTYRHGRYQADRMPVNTITDVNASGVNKVVKARGTYGYDDVTGLPNGYRDFGDDRITSPVKLDGVGKSAGENQKYIDSSGRIRSEFVYSDKLDSYRPGDFQQQRLTNDRIQKSKDRRGVPRSVTEQREFKAQEELFTERQGKRTRTDKLPSTPEEAADPTFRRGYGFKARQSDATLPPGRVPEGTSTSRVRAQEVEVRGLSQQQRLDRAKGRLQKLMANRSSKIPMRRAELWEPAGKPQAPLVGRSNQRIAQRLYERGQTIRPTVVQEAGKRVDTFDPSFSPSSRVPYAPEGRIEGRGQYRTTNPLNSSDLEANRIRAALKRKTTNITEKLNDNTGFVVIKEWTPESYRKYADEYGLPTNDIAKHIKQLNANLRERYPELANADHIILSRKEGQQQGLRVPYNPDNNGMPIGGHDIWLGNPVADTTTPTPRTTKGRIAERLQSRGEPNHRGYNHGYESGKRPEATIDGVDNRKGERRSPRRVITNPDGKKTRHNINTGRRGVYDNNGNLVKTEPRTTGQHAATKASIDDAINNALKFNNANSVGQLSDKAREGLFMLLADRVARQTLPKLSDDLRQQLVDSVRRGSYERRLKKYDGVYWNNIQENIYRDLSKAIEDNRKYINYDEVYGVQGAAQQLRIGRNNPSTSGMTQKDFQGGDLRGYNSRGFNVGDGRASDSWSESPIEEARRRQRRRHN